MAKPLIFKLNNKEYSLEPIQLEHKKLYGEKYQKRLGDQTPIIENWLSFMNK